MEEVSADRAYLSNEDLTAIEAAGAPRSRARARIVADRCDAQFLAQQN